MFYSGRFASLLVVTISLLVPGRFSEAAGVNVETSNAIYQGFESESGKVAIFYGIPYAQPPLGERRFKAPVPLTPFTGSAVNKPVKNVTATPKFCIQGAANPFDPSNPGGAGSEDCLHLNIYTPKSAVTSRARGNLPVLVYIHGGGFIYGNPLSWPLGPWVEQFPNVVIVSIYYRLHIFGFLAAPTKAGNKKLDLNAGFLDQLEALKWIKKNIGSFGGDSDRITINGQSAGGDSVLLHLVANGGQQNLFQQGIAQSVFREGLNRIGDANLKDHFDFTVQFTGCNIAGYSDADKVECLRTKDVYWLERAMEAAMRTYYPWHYGPVVDGTIFKDTPMALVNKGKISHVPVLAGATSNETFASSANLTAEMKAWYPALSEQDLTDLSNIYPAANYTSPAAAIAELEGETLLRCGGRALVEAMEKAGKPSYFYRFNEPDPSYGIPQLVLHSAENWWMFQGTGTRNNGTFSLTPFTTPDQERFAKELIAYWVSFVEKGNPNTLALPGSPNWPKWNDVGGRRMVLKLGSGNASGSSVETDSADEAGRCHAVNKMAKQLQF